MHEVAEKQHLSSEKRKSIKEWQQDNRDEIGPTAQPREQRAQPWIEQSVQGFIIPAASRRELPQMEMIRQLHRACVPAEGIWLTWAWQEEQAHFPSSRIASATDDTQAAPCLWYRAKPHRARDCSTPHWPSGPCVGRPGRTAQAAEETRVVTGRLPAHEWMDWTASLSYLHEHEQGASTASMRRRIRGPNRAGERPRLPTQSGRHAASR